MQGCAATVTVSLGAGQWPPSVWRAQLRLGCCLPSRLPGAVLPPSANSQGSQDTSWLGQGRGQSLPCGGPHPISSTHLVCLPHPSIVSNVLPKCAEPVHLHTGDRMAGSTPHRGWVGRGLGRGGARGCGLGRGVAGAWRGTLRARSRSAPPPAPRSSSRTGGSCTPTASGSAGPRSCSTSPACCRFCRSSGLGGGRGGLSGRPCQPQHPAFPACPLGGASVTRAHVG